MQHAARQTIHVTRHETRADTLWVVIYAVAMVGLLTLAIGGFNLVGDSFTPAVVAMGG